MTTTRTPAGLGKHGKRLWREVTDDYDLEAWQLELLHLGCQALDRCHQAAEHVAEHGAITTDRFGALKASPAVAIERDARIAVARVLRELALEVDDVGTVRPPRLGSIRGGGE